MNYIKFDTIKSTNNFLKSYILENTEKDFFYVYTDEQINGKGQGSNIWESECCKNILISLYVKPFFTAKEQYRLNHIVSVSIVKVLQKFNIPDVKIKLPNDILSGTQKISGILIENSIFGTSIKQSIIGIGLNVNQCNFVNLPNAVSMKMLTGQEFDTEIVLQELLNELQIQYQANKDELKKEFTKMLISKV